MLTVPLLKLGYFGVKQEKYLLFREDNGGVEDDAPGRTPFVHGATGPQERVRIPVLVVRKQRERGGSDTVFGGPRRGWKTTLVAAASSFAKSGSPPNANWRALVHGLIARDLGLRA
jgi:hypothetical protein